MSNLQETHPYVCAKFQERYHVVRRSDRFWAGLSTALAIEQVFMRSLKTTGGLTWGRGMTELQTTVWLLSNPTCAEVNRAMQEVTNVVYEANEQHKETSQVRLRRDFKDSLKILQFVIARNPFDNRKELTGIDTGEIAIATVNVDQAKKIASDILESMCGNPTKYHTFEKKDTTVTVKVRSTVQTNGEIIAVDPLLMF